MKVVKKYKLQVIRKILMYTKYKLLTVIKMSNINKGYYIGYDHCN